MSTFSIVFHSLSGIPTIYEEIHKIIDVNRCNKKYVDDKNYQKTALIFINHKSKTDFPLLKNVTIQGITYAKALDIVISLKSHKNFETMMLLFEYMEQNRSFKIEKLSGTELLKFANHKGIRQIHRSRILTRIAENSKVTAQVLDPKKSKNTPKQEELAYKVTSLITIKEIVYSKQNPYLIKELIDIEFLPQYIQHFKHISRRYIPLATIRKVNTHASSDKTRYFLYKLCLKFASSRKRVLDLSLRECINLGEFYNETRQSIKRQWKAIEKALAKAEKLELIMYTWVFREDAPGKIQPDITSNSYNEVEYFSANKVLKEGEHQYITKVRVLRKYALENTK